MQPIGGITVAGTMTALELGRSRQHLRNASKITFEAAGLALPMRPVRESGDRLLATALAAVGAPRIQGAGIGRKGHQVQQR